jgi:hypothetical protein
MFQNYHSNYSTSTLSLPFFINRLGHDLLGLQLGVGEGVCTCYLLQSCPIIKKIHLIDLYAPYEDFIGYSNYKTNACVSEKIVKNLPLKKVDEDSIPLLSVGENETEKKFDEAVYNLISSGYIDSIDFFRLDSEVFLKTVEDETYDFIFLDAHLTYEQAYRDLVHWTPKLKSGGALAMHDYFHVETYHAVQDYRRDYGIDDKLYRFHNDGVVWFKHLKGGIAEVKPNWA